MTTTDFSPVEALQLVDTRRRRVGLRNVMTQLEVASSSALTGRPEQWRAQVLPLVGVLHEAWASHVHGTEGAGGLWEQIRTDAPRLDARLRLLRREHVAVTAEVESLQRDLTDADDGEEGLGKVRERVVALLARLVRHRQRGADLIYEAYSQDIGGMG